ncbi:MAG: YjcG family protein [Bacillus sp. (in: firmicutes)]
MKFGIVIFPSKKLQDQANSYRKRYDPHYTLIPPHLTLKYPFDSTEEQVNELAETIKDVSNQCEPFQLKVLKVSSFKPVNNVIYLKVELNKALDNLQKKLHNLLIDQDVDPEFTFVPHITLGQKLSNDEHSDVLGQLSMLDVTHEETIDRIHLVYQLENGSWTVYETFRLGKD